ncbi:hypothetical protein Pcinc_008567 [Petrolisthes cinctipes]|uniref:Uncharacterized protein n=1 Tax=Petrolisthes cinctipes TaxID=88211 RepID=A0AAE1KX44_PETCI|nr:hypothetical protein Pcinc_008567 [Petrolisthes cinctipes]
MVKANGDTNDTTTSNSTSVSEELQDFGINGLFSPERNLGPCGSTETESKEDCESKLESESSEGSLNTEVATLQQRSFDANAVQTVRFHLVVHVRGRYLALRLEGHFEEFPISVVVERHVYELLRQVFNAF